jgi:putative ABC transport system permease protein
MLRNYFKIILRNLKTQKVFSAINLLGLTVSLTAVIFISLYIRYELSYDKYLPTSGNVYRLYTENTRLKEDANKLQLPTGLAEMLKKEFPEVKEFVQINQGKQEFIGKNGNIKVGTLDAGNNYFTIFPFTFIAGNPQHALSEKNSIVLTESAAKKIFGNTNPLNQVLMNTQNEPFTVTAIVKDIPANTHFEAEAIVNLSYPWALKPLNWKAYSGIYQYVLLGDNVEAGALQKKFKSVYEKYAFPKDIELVLQPVTAIHLHSNFSGELSVNSDIRYIYIFGLAALLLLFLAGINYINLSTARSLHRAKETGIRKVLGAQRKGIIIQFLSETILFFLLATIASIVLTIIFSAFIAGLLHINPDVFTAFDTASLLVFLGGIIFFGVMAGLYPAFYLSKQAPAFIIKGIMSRNAFNVTLRKALVVFQFGVSIFFIIATITIFQQLRFIQHKKLGFDKEQLLMIAFNRYGKNVEIFKNRLQQNPAIKNISISSWSPGIGYGGSGSWDDQADSSKKISVDMMFTDVHFIKSMGIELIAGRDFSEKHPLDTLEPSGNKKLTGEAFRKALSDRSLILNETAVKVLGLQLPVVGTRLSYPALQGTVIGIVKDFNGLSLHHKVAPLALRAEGNMTSGYTFIRINPGNMHAAIETIKNEWKKTFPEKSFEISFVDESLEKLYTSEKRLAALFSSFALLGIGIACLGIFGLASYMAEQRSKEIGIRKVLGASVKQIVDMLSRQFLRSIFLGALVIFPVAWWFLDYWLRGFAYRISINWWVFASATLIAAIIALVTISYQSIKAAIASPVKSLRTE